MGQAFITNRKDTVEKIVEVEVNPKNYIYQKGGTLKITPSAQASTSTTTSGIYIYANGYLTLPYVKTGEMVYVRFTPMGDGAYNSFSTSKALTGGYNANTNYGTIMCAYAQINKEFIIGGASSTVISLAFSQTVLITEIWTEAV